MAHAAAVFAERDQETVEFRCGLLRQFAHGLDDLPGLLACLEAEALVGYHHQFFGIHVVDHADRRTLWGVVSVIGILAVIALALDVWLGMYMAAKMDGDPVRALDIERIPEVPDRRVPRLQDGVFPLAGGRSDRLLANGDKRPAFAFQPVGVGGGGNDRYKVIHFSISSISKNFRHIAAT